MISLYPLDRKGVPTHEALTPPKSFPQSRYYTQLAGIFAIMMIIAIFLLRGDLGFKGFYQMLFGWDLFQPWLVVLIALCLTYLWTIRRARKNLDRRLVEQSIDSTLIYSSL